ncbi:pilin [Aeromonas allosaccharophila]|uniref:pilin n=1 Tax=Aeromonas allosaccharophila TaxID=656 RepID=UPI003BF96503
MNSEMKKQSGFTLIELMIVVAIVAILAAIALPAYQTYTKKAKFTEVVAATGSLKTAVEVCFNANGDMTKCLTAGTNGIPTIAGYPKGFVASLTLAAAPSNASAAAITATATSDLDDDTYILTGENDNGAVKWTKSGTCTTSGLC